MTTAIAEAPAIQNIQLTVEEYLAFEEKALEKHEFRNGKLTIIPGGTIDHGTIAISFASALKIVLRLLGLKNRVVGSDNQIWMPAIDRFVYPDAAVIEGQAIFYPGQGKRGISNPLLIVEVLSDSTEAYDRGEKFDNYATLESFREYVLVSQDKPKIKVFYRENAASDLWQIKTYSGMDATCKLNSIGAEIKLADVYEGIEFEPKEETPSEA